MNYNSNKVFSLINSRESSLSGFAKKIGMSHTGLKAGLDNKTLGVKYVIAIAEYFRMPIEYFFTNDEMPDQVNDKSLPYKTISPDYSNKPDKCTNPECLLRENQLLEENRQLRKQKDKLNEELAELRKGGTHDGKSSSGGVGQREAG